MAYRDADAPLYTDIPEDVAVSVSYGTARVQHDRSPAAAAPWRAGRSRGCCAWLRGNYISSVDALATTTIMPPRVLLALRVIFVLWNIPAAVIMGIEYWQTSTSKLPLGVTLSYISYCSIQLYLLVAIINIVRNRTLWRRTIDYPYWMLTQQTASLSLRLQWVMFEVLVPIAYLVTIVYWTLLHPREKHRDAGWTTIHMHAVNSVIMSVELWSTRLPVIPRHVVVFLCFGVMYLLWGIMWYQISDKWIYFFLDYNKTSAAYFYPGVFALGIFLYFVVHLLTRARDRWLIDDRMDGSRKNSVNVTVEAYHRSP